MKTTKKMAMILALAMAAASMNLPALADDDGAAETKQEESHDSGSSEKSESHDSGSSEKSESHDSGSSEKSESHDSGSSEKSESHDSGSSEKSESHDSGSSEKSESHDSGSSEKSESHDSGSSEKSESHDSGSSEKAESSDNGGSSEKAESSESGSSEKSESHDSGSSEKAESSDNGGSSEKAESSDSGSSEKAESSDNGGSSEKAESSDNGGSSEKTESNDSAEDSAKAESKDSGSSEKTAEAKDVSIQARSIESRDPDPTPTNGEPISVSDGETHEYEGDIVTDSSRIGVDVNNENTNVTLNGNVTHTGEEGYAVDITKGSATINGDVTGTGGVNSLFLIHTNENGQLTVNGDVIVNTYEESDGIDESHGTVTVNGDVILNATRESGDGENNTDMRLYGGTVTVNGNITLEGGVRNEGADISQGGTLNVTGNVSTNGQEARSIWVHTGSDNATEEYLNTVNVGGNVTANGESSTAITVAESFVGKNLAENILNIGGDVIAAGDGSNAIELEHSATIFVGGEIKADNVALSIVDTDDSPDDTHETIIVAEDGIYGANAAIRISTNDESTYEIPVIVTEGLETGENGTLISGVNEDTAKTLLASVNYIVTDEDNKMNATGDIETLTVGDTEYTVSHYGDTITFSPTVKKGYKLNKDSFGAYKTSVVDNKDGTYTITVSENGHLTFSLKLDKIQAKKILHHDDHDDSGSTARRTAPKADAAQAENTAAAGTILARAKQGMTLRADGTTKGAKLGNIRKGQIVEVLDRSGSYWKVIADGVTGYAYGQYFTVIRSNH